MKRRRNPAVPMFAMRFQRTRKPELGMMAVPADEQRGGRKTVTLFAQPYLDTYNECYRTIVTVNAMPLGPLAERIRRIQTPPLSTFQVPGPCTEYNRCALAVLGGGGCFGKGCASGLMDANDVPALLAEMMDAGYEINTSVTKMLQQSGLTFGADQGKRMICLATYPD